MKRKLHDNQIYVGVIRVKAVDEHGSHRAKFVYINYVGTNVVRIFLICFLGKWASYNFFIKEMYFNIFKKMFN